MANNRVRRSQYFINRKVQLEISLLVTAVTLAVAGGFFAVYVKGVVSLIQDVGNSIDPLLAAEASTKKASAYAVAGLSVYALLAIACLAFSIRRSHRVAGPLRRIERHLDQLLEGEFDTRIRLRSSDELHMIAEKLNQLSTQMKKRSESDRSAS